MKDKTIQAFELDYFIEAIYLRYGYDFRHYSRASLKRRVENRMRAANLKHISQMVPKLLYQPGFFELFLNDMSVSVTEMFRDPEVYLAIRKQLIPKLRTYSRINIWHVGCATGEEVYSMAILLEEEGLLSKSRLYATDFNEQCLSTAKNGIYSGKALEKYRSAYLRAGGNASLDDHIHARYQSFKVNEHLKQQITFAHHNLMSDGMFAEMQLILCRNVLIYFDRQLQDQVLRLLSDSLTHRGFLVLGNKESLDFSDVHQAFDALCLKSKIYRQKASFEF